VLDDLALRRHGLADAVHGVDVLHGSSGATAAAVPAAGNQPRPRAGRRRQEAWGSVNYSRWRAPPKSWPVPERGAVEPAGPGRIQPRRAMLTPRTHVEERQMSVSLRLSALLLALAAVVALPASAAGRDHDRGKRGHDRQDHH